MGVMSHKYWPPAETGIFLLTTFKNVWAVFGPGEIWGANPFRGAHVFLELSSASNSVFL